MNKVGTLIIMYQNWITNCGKCAILLQDVNNWKTCVCVREREIETL